MKIGIMGLGQVGSTLEYGFKRIGHHVVGYDPKLKGSRLEDIDGTDVCFICVPTPSRLDGACDVSIVEKAVADLESLTYSGVVAIKSTVTPGTTDRLQHQYQDLRLAFCPEFLREKSKFSDFVENHDVCIIGTAIAEDTFTFEAIKYAHGSLPKQFAWTSSMEAEFAKYFSNCFNALRITFANEFASICEAAGADYNNVKNAITKRSNIGDHYLDSNESFRAFGGNCLPKDTEAFSHYAATLGRSVDLLDAMIGVNDVFQEEGKKDVTAA